MPGLLHLQSPNQLTQSEQVQPAPTQPTQTQLVQHIHAAWQRNKRAREQLDRRLLNCLRRRKGVYAESELREFQSQGCLTTLFMPLSATKCRAAAA